MRKIVTTTFVTLDGVMQAPGGPGEDDSGGFAHGGWAASELWDDVMGSTMDEIMRQPFELLLGRWTYDIFAAYWPTAATDQEVAVPFNRTIKHVVSREQIELNWQNSQLITGDVVPQIEQLKAQAGPDLWVHGSGNLIQTLLAHDLVDRMFVWTFPVTVGSGKRLFAEGVPHRRFRLIDCTTSTTGVTIATYEPAGKLDVGTSGRD